MSTTAISEANIKLPSDQDISGRTFGKEELDAIADVLKTGTLITTKGKYGRMLEEAFAKRFGVKYAYACNSGSAAVHVAIAAINPNPGDEIITTSITDMGALTPIVFQGAIPVFADVDPKTLNVTAETIERVLSDRTKAIIVTHLFGNPCEMRAIMELADSRGIPVIEDTAQSFLAQCDGEYVGTIGKIGAFSFQQGKHMTTGEGGIVVTNDDALARRMYLFINKAWGYGDPNPDHYFASLNYRMTELQAALAYEQLKKLDACVEQRRKIAGILHDGLKDIDGIESYEAADGSTMTYWKYCLRVDDSKLADGSVGLAKALKVYDVASAPRYVVKPAFRCKVFAEQNTFGDSHYPFNLARPEAVDYSEEHFPGTFKGLHDVLVLPINEKYTVEHANFLVASIKDAANSIRVA
ncbi:MAG TPA: DegT/DnrJ/EryC1/StrS family aminotransferase [Pyrinomonadaceae bacterium]|nr:DegT/DnrJ/EryC1/StrS family aminotransferase [Pyrinomonadaceae bacterium]